MNRIIFLSVIMSLSFLSCKKEQIAPKASPKEVKTSTSDTKGLHCYPWRDAADADAAAADLNAIGICNTSTCSSGSTTYLYLNNSIVKDASGSIVYFPAYTTVTIADQNAIWNNAVSQGVANTPTGYSLSSIGNFRTELAGTMFVSYRMKFDMVYIKCTGGGGGSEN